MSVSTTFLRWLIVYCGIIGLAGVPAFGETAQLGREHGLYMLPVQTLGLTGGYRTQFINSSIAACNRAVTRDHPEIAANKVATYCQCMAEKEADITSRADIDYVSQYHIASADYQARILAVAPACRTQAGISKGQ